MKFQQTERFVADRRRLTDEEFRRFRQVVQDDFIPTAERHVGDPGSSWPARLRVKSVQGARGVWEMTWSFAGPDGRATFEWVQIDHEQAIRWRRVGSHAIFTDP
ncbi:MAG: hypothetical protein ACRDZR_00175 [Acidimicrobiales bacterium]